MRLGLTAKLFLSMLTMSAIAVLAMSIGSRISFSRGFLGYLNEQGVARIEALRPTLIAAYERNGSWNFLRGDPRSWFHLLRNFSSGLSYTAEFQPPKSGLALESTELQDIDLRIGLLDANGQRIAGNAEIGPDAARLPIVVRDHRVGWLSVLPFERVNGAANLRFEQRQHRVTGFIALGAVLFAGVMALWLAQQMLSPLKLVTAAVHRLAAGDFSARTPKVSRDEIGALAEDCNRLAEALGRTEAMRKDFTADVSHELRTPLAILRGELEALEDGVRQPDTEAIHSLQSEVYTLSKLVDDLYQLSLADVGALSYRMEELDVSACAHDVLANYCERLALKNIRVETNDSAAGQKVMADIGRLRQVFRNILENTLRYADSEGELRVECRRQNDQVIISFEDSGPGVPNELLPRLFDRFYRVEGSRSRARGGAGLGLSLCKYIIEAHRGTIDASRSRLGGLSVAIALPIMS